MLNGTNKTNFVITLIILSLALFIHLLGFKESLIKVLLLSREEESNYSEDYPEDFSIKKIIPKNNDNTELLSLLTNKNMLPVNYDEDKNNLIYFNLDVSKTNFKVSYHNDILTNFVEEKEIQLIGVTNNVKENNLYVTYADKLYQKVGIMNLNYETPHLAVSISDVSLDKKLNFKKSQPVIVKNSQYSLIILFSDNNLNVNVLGRNYLLKDEEIISPTECIKYKFVEIESHLSEDHSYLILALIYYCADLTSINLKYSNLFLKIEKKGKGDKFQSKLKEIHKFHITDYSDIYELTTSEYFQPKLKQNLINKHAIKTNGKDVFLIKLNDDLLILQKFRYENILQENYINLFELSYQEIKIGDKLYSINLENSKIVFNNQNLFIFSQVGKENIYLYKIKLIDDLSSIRTGDIKRIKLKLNSALEALEIKELSAHILITDRNESPFNLMLIEK